VKVLIQDVHLLESASVEPTAADLVGPEAAEVGQTESALRFAQL